MALKFTRLDNSDSEVYDKDNTFLGEISWGDGTYYFYPETTEVSITELKEIVKYIETLNDN